MHIFLLSLLLIADAGSRSVQIDLARNSEREQRTRARLEKLLASNNLREYIFTRNVVIEEGAVNHAFPVLTLNARFADSDDDLLASFIHEQVHWHLRAHQRQQQAAIADLRRMYPRAPVGLPEGAESAYSTYGHLVTCYLEVQAARRLIGPERTASVVANKGHYTWIYETVLRDESRIASVVARYRLAVQ